MYTEEEAAVAFPVPFSIALVRVLPVKICVAPKVTTVSVTSGNDMVLFVEVVAAKRVRVRPAPLLDALNAILFVVSVGSTKKLESVTRSLLESVALSAVDTAYDVTST
jgi:hypothetical protein